MEIKPLNNFLKIRAYTKFLRSIKSILIENCYLGNKLKIGHFGQKMDIGFVEYSDEKIGNKKLRFAGTKS